MAEKATEQVIPVEILQPKESEDEAGTLPAGKFPPVIGALTTFNCVVGVGVLYLPAAFMKAGIVVATILCALVAVLVYYTSCMVVDIGQKIGVWSYEEICLAVLGRWGYYTLASCCVLFNWCACLSYLLSIHEMMTPVLIRLWGLQGQPWFEWTHASVIFTIVCTMPFLIPLSLKRDLSALQFVSILKAVVMAATMITVFILGNTSKVKDYQNFRNWNSGQLGTFLDDLVEGSPGTNWNNEAETFFTAWEAEKAANAEPIINPRVTSDPSAPGYSPAANGLHQTLAGIPKNGEDYAAKFAELLDRNNPNAKRDDTTIGQRFGKAVPYMFNTGGIGKFGTFIFSFVFHDSMFSVLKTVNQPNASGWRKTATYSLSMIFGVQVLFGIVVAMMFGMEIPSNFLSSSADSLPVFPIGDVVTSIIQIAFSIVLMLTYPVCIVLCREYVESIILLFTNTQQTGAGQPALDLSGKGVSRKTSIIIALILIATTLPWLLAPSAGETAAELIDIFGALAAGCMAFVLPSLCYKKVYNELPLRPLAVLVLGAIIVVVCPIFSALEMAKVDLGVMAGLPKDSLG